MKGKRFTQEQITDALQRNPRNPVGGVTLETRAVRAVRSVKRRNANS